MKHFFHDMLGQATRMTQGGNLQAATELIQRTLRDAGLNPDLGAGFGPTAMPGSTAAPSWAPGRPADAASAGSAGSGEVIDVESRFIDEPTAPVSPVSPVSPASSEPAGQPASEGESWQAGSFTHQGRTLAYKLYVPPRAAGAAAAPRPLLLMLHGCTQNPDDFAAGTRMNALAREAGMLVLYPEQVQRANAQKCWNWFKRPHQQRERGEPALLAALTRQVMAQHGADPARVYVAGLSAGGAMADILGRTHPELFAAVGVHSGLPADAAADLPSALAAMRSGPGPQSANPNSSAPSVRPLIVFHGDADATVNPANGQAVADAACRAQPIAGTPQVRTGRSPQGQRFTHTVHRAADGSPRVEHWQLHGAAHAWSGGSAAGSYTAPTGIDASAEMLRFFQVHRHPAAR